jgi:hypothetical protein
MALDLKAVVTQLQSCVPEGATLEYFEPRTVEVAYSGEAPSLHVVARARNRNDSVAAVRALLSHVQDYITVSIRRPWPELRGNLALPQVQEKNVGVIHAWYGTQAEVVLDVGEFRI